MGPLRKDKHNTSESPFHPYLPSTHPRVGTGNWRTCHRRAPHHWFQAQSCTPHRGPSRCSSSKHRRLRGLESSCWGLGSLEAVKIKDKYRVCSQDMVYETERSECWHDDDNVKQTQSHICIFVLCAEVVVSTNNSLAGKRLWA